jgi:putative heme iron utilization protein
MASDDITAARSQDGGKEAAARLARDLVRTAWKASLGTIDRTGGYPYASLVAAATQPDGSPLLLLSGLAEHAKNIAADQRCSILFDGTSADRAALTGARVTLVGRLREAEPATARRRYLARHPDASGFVDFADFKLYQLDIEWAHLVAGFGRILRLQVDDLSITTSDAAAIIDAEPGILEHMNADHADAIAAMAMAHSGAANLDGRLNSGQPVGSPIDEWRMVGCDPEGFDLTDGHRAVRIRFATRVTTTDAVRRELVAITAAARTRSAG